MPAVLERRARDEAMEQKMVKITFMRQANGTAQTVAGAVGRSVMQVAAEQGLHGIDAECGGQLSCATCHVFVDPAWAALWPARSADEEAMLEATSEEPTAYSRLSCQLVLQPEHDGAIVHVPKSQKF